MAVTRLDRNIRVLNWAAAIALFISMITIFFYAPIERTMGNVQRLFYFHVGSAWVGAVAFFVALVGGVLYLRRPAKKWDTIALASVEIGLVFLTMAIVAGSVWGRPAWNTWWLWSPRLTLVTIAWLTYAAYFMLRGAIEDDEKRGRFAAVYTIVAFVTIIMAYLSVRILRDIHPVVFGGTIESAQGAAEGLQDFAPGLESLKMVLTLNVTVVAFSLLYVAWLANRIRLQNIMDEATVLKMRVAARLQGEHRFSSYLFLATILWQTSVGDPNRFNGYLMLGYGVMWLIGLIYVGTLLTRQRNLHQDIRLLQQILQEDEEAAN
jgi:heme exporter protein C